MFGGIIKTKRQTFTTKHCRLPAAVEALASQSVETPVAGAVFELVAGTAVVVDGTTPPLFAAAVATGTALGAAAVRDAVGAVG